MGLSVVTVAAAAIDFDGRRLILMIGFYCQGFYGPRTRTAGLCLESAPRPPLWLSQTMIALRSARPASVPQFMEAQGHLDGAQPA
jgi:hypothetical protein